jgi:hypothetical protein
MNRVRPALLTVGRIGSSRGTTHAPSRNMDDRQMMTAPAFLEIMTQRQPRPASIADGVTALGTSEERQLARERLWAVREVLGALDETAVTTRAHLMQQVIEVLQADILRPTLRLGKRQLDT